MSMNPVDGPSKTIAPPPVEHAIKNASPEMADIAASVAEARKKAMAMPLPRNTCPGCFSAIYDGAAEQGWCCNCFDPVKNKPRY